MGVRLVKGLLLGAAVLAASCNVDDPAVGGDGERRGSAPTLESVEPADGVAGDEATITGSGFGKARGLNKLTLGAALLPSVKWTDTSIIFYVPNSAPPGTFPLAITVGDAIGESSLSFTVKPRIDSISTSGSSIVIVGTNFGYTQSGGGVIVSGVSVEIEAWSNTRVRAALPSGLKKPEAQIIAGNVESNVVGFRLPPFISSLAPLQGRAGITALIAGSYFGSTVQTVTFGDKQATIVSWSDTQIAVIVPPRLASYSSKTIKVSVTVQGLKSNGVDFTALPTAIYDVLPYTVFIETEVTVTGVGFGTSPGELWIDGVLVTPISWSDGAISFAVPPGSVPGYHQVRVVTAGGDEDYDYFILSGPAIHALTPDNGEGGDAVIVLGGGLGGAPGELWFGQSQVTPLAWSPAAVTFTVPPATIAGVYPVKVTTSGGTGTTPRSFTVRPVLLSISPATAPSFTGVTLTGRLFGDVQGSSRLQFGAAAATISTWSDTLITAEVPVTAPAGNIAVKVTVNGASSTAIRFEHQRPWIDMRYPQDGTTNTVVELQGRYFGAISGAAFIGGIPATVLGWTETDVSLRVPAGVSSGKQPLLVHDVNGLPSNSVNFTHWGHDVWIVEEPLSLCPGQTAVWTGSEFLFWGGSVDYQFWCAGNRYSPATDTWLSFEGDAEVQTSRRQHSAVWTGVEMVIFGGRAADGWYGSRTKTGAAYDPVTRAWRKLSDAPGARYLHHAVFAGDKMLVWGGEDEYGESTTEGFVYEIAMDTWSAMTTVGAPSARYEGYEAFFWTGSELLIYSAWDDYSYYESGGALYSPATNEWRAVSGDGAPPLLQNASYAWAGSTLFVWGGYKFEWDALGDATLTPQNAGYRFDATTSTWSPMSVDANTPSPRRTARAVPAGDKIAVFGGQPMSGTGQDGALYDIAGDSWSPMNVEGAPVFNSLGYSTVYATGHTVVILQTGDSFGAVKYDPTLDAWSSSTNHGIPIAREDHTAVWTGAEMIIWGGNTLGGYQPVATGARYVPATDTWIALPTSPDAPEARAYHAAAAIDGKMLVWGGLDYFGDTLADGGVFDPSTGSWTPMSNANAPSSRYLFAMAAVNGVAVIWGGATMSYYDAADVNTGGRYTLATHTWQPTSLTGVPTARKRASVAAAGSAIIVWGGDAGYYPVTFFNTGGRYDPAADTWLATSTFGAPAARSSHSAIWTGTEMIVWGGRAADPQYQSSTIRKNDGGRYEPSGNTWTQLSSGMANVPAARQSHTAVWTGREMLVWGGWGSNYSTLRSGGRYDPGANSWAPMNLADAPPATDIHTAVWDATTEQMLVFPGGRYMP